MLRKFIWQREDEPQNMLTYLFLMVNLSYGINFTFFGYTEAVKASVISNALFPSFFWGVACLLLVVGTLWGIYTRKQIIGGSMGFPGVCIWGYGFVLSLAVGQFLAAFAVYLPQVLFWIFWHIGVMRYFDKEKNVKQQQ